MPQPKPAKARPTLILLLGFLILLPALAFLALFSTTPGDHTRLRYSLPPSPLGLRIESRLNGDSTAGQDTYLLAINAQTVDNLLSNLVANPLQSQPASRAEEYPYLITDGTNTQEILVQFATPSFIRLLVEDWSFFLSFLLLLSVSSVVYFRRPELPAARTYFILSCLIVSSGLVFFIGIRASDLLTGLIFWLWIWSVLPIYGLLVGAVVHFALVFPEPRPVLRRHPSAILLAYICVWIPYLALAAALLPSYVTPSQRIQVLLEGTGVMTLSGFLLALAIAIASYFRSFSSRQRRQTRWVLWGSMIAILPWLAVTVVPALLGYPTPNLPIIGVLWWAIPISFAIAILRENLFDIDTLINRTIVYLVLSLLLALIYFASVTAMQGIISSVSGQESTIAIVISTLAIAALFNPLRGRIQRLIDRRFYRRKYNAEQALAAFSISVRDEVDLESLSQELLSVVNETIQPESVAVWLKEGSE